VPDRSQVRGKAPRHNETVQIKLEPLTKAVCFQADSSSCGAAKFVNAGTVRPIHPGIA
jgi:hypothetical protein